MVMSIHGANSLHVFLSFVAAIIALFLITSTTFEIRVGGLMLLLADIIQFGMLYEKL